MFKSLFSRSALRSALRSTLNARSRVVNNMQCRGVLTSAEKAAKEAAELVIEKRDNYVMLASFTAFAGTVYYALFIDHTFNPYEKWDKYFKAKEAKEEKEAMEAAIANGGVALAASGGGLEDIQEDNAFP